MKDYKRRLNKIEDKTDHTTIIDVYSFILGKGCVHGNRLYDREEDIPPRAVQCNDNEATFDLPTLLCSKALGDRFLIEGKIYEKLEDFPHPHGKPEGVIFEPILNSKGE